MKLSAVTLSRVLPMAMLAGCGHTTTLLSVVVSTPSAATTVVTTELVARTTMTANGSKQIRVVMVCMCACCAFVAAVPEVGWTGEQEVRDEVAVRLVRVAATRGQGGLAICAVRGIGVRVIVGVGVALAAASAARGLAWKYARYTGSLRPRKVSHCDSHMRVTRR